MTSEPTNYSPAFDIKLETLLVRQTDVANSMETYYRVHYERLVNPSHTWNEIEAATAQIKSDERLMTKLRAEIAERNRQIAEQESWREQ